MTATATQAPSPRLVFAIPAFRRYLVATVLEDMAIQMQSTAIGWQVYMHGHRTLDLGFVGLAQFLPAFFLSLATGHVADRYDRRRILMICSAVFLVCSGLLALLARQSSETTHTPVYAVLVLFGTARAFARPADKALSANLVPPALLAPAVAVNSTTWQLSVILGPTLGGAIYALGHGPSAVYFTCAGLGVLNLAFLARLPTLPVSPAGRAAGLRTVLDGVRYIRAHPVVLGAISLDLFAVLLGGAVALLPAIADQSLHVRTVGLGVLRSAPAVGAAVTALWLAYRPLQSRPGTKMLCCVALFGAATVVFGVSHHFVLSLLALVVIGASDMVSVVVRQALIQIATPDAMRGRVSAVNMVFVGASNELGEFESGLTASWWGTIPAVVIGGLGTLAVVALWAAMFPSLRDVESLDSTRPEPAA